MKKSIIYILISLLAVFSSSCLSTRDTNLLQTLNIPYPIQPYTEYTILPGDLLQCAIYTKDPQFNGVFRGVIGNNKNAMNTFVVGENGNITLPFFGDIHVVGYTLREAEDVVQRYMRESIKDAQVRVKLQNNYFFILSDGTRGRYNIYKENMTIFQALAISGQPDGNRLKLSNVKIVRKNENGETYTKSFDLRTQDIIQSEFYYVRPNDLWYIETDKKNFFGDFRSFGSIQSFIYMIASLGVLIFSISL